MSEKQKKTLKRTGIILVLVLSLSVVAIFSVVPFSATGGDVLTLQPIYPDPDLDGNVLLEWNDVGDTYKYTVELSWNNREWHIIKGGIKSLDYMVTGLVDGEYRFRVTAIPWYLIPYYISNIEDVTVQLADIPEAPFMNDLDYEIVEDTIIIYLDWEEVDCDSYNLYRSVNYINPEIIADNLVSTDYSENLTEVGVYKYYVTAVSNVGESEPSQVVVAIVTEEGTPEEPPVDYSMAIVVVLVLAILIVPVVILVKRKKR